MSFIVGIDGPAGTGKGTITDIISKKYNFVNIDTGATYRCVALKMLQENIDLDNEKGIDQILKNIKIEFKIEKGNQKVFLDGVDVSTKIREKEVTEIVSQVSSIKQVRLSLTALQRKMAQGKNVVMEGRDICTVVFPTADVKIYLDATTEERAKRRFKQNQEKGLKISYEETLENIKMRDKNDKEKEMGALKIAEGAKVIDSTNLTIKQVEKEVSKLINKKLKEKKKEEKIYKIRKETLWKKSIRAVIKFLIHIFYKVMFRIESIGEENIPQEEAVIICANHINTWDAVGLVTSCKRKLYFVAKEDLFNNGFLNWIAHVFDVIPIKRGMRDMEAMKRCIKVLNNKEVLGIFPEGTRNGLEKGAKVQNGAAYMAIKSKVKVVPVGIQGTFKPFSKVKLNFGKPLNFEKYYSKNPAKEDLDIATSEIMENIIMLTNNGKK